MPYRKLPWIAKVTKDGKQHYLGAFETFKEAKKVEDEFRDRHNLPKTRKEMTALAHKTMKLLGTNSNGYITGTRKRKTERG